MAALQTLRNKAGVFIAAIIALALLAFILTDLLGSTNIFSNSDVAGKIDGRTVKIQELQQRIERAEAFAKMNSQTGSLSEEQQNQIREQVWSQLVRDEAFSKVYENAGIEVTDEEMLDMVTGNHIAPVLRQLFVNQQTGAYDVAMADNFLRNKNSDPNANFFWSNIEEGLKDSRLSQKYFSLISQSIYCNKAQVEVEKKKRSQEADIAFVNVRYSAIADSTIAVADSEVKNLYNKNKENYKVDENVDLEYITFPIRPTEADREDTRKALEELKADFASKETDAFRFAQMNSEAPVYNIFRTADKLTPALADFVAGAAEGDVYGPYKDGDKFLLSRLVSASMRPDSVKARHILIRSDNKALADSLLALVKNGGDFAAIARANSQDQGSAINGGDLDWFSDGMMVPEFNEACFTSPKGTITMVQSQFGYHIINVQDVSSMSKKYSIATIEKTVQYSTRTQQEVFSKANQIISQMKDAKSFNQVVDTANLVKRLARGIRSNAQSINNMRQAREIVKWAFNAEVGDVSDLFQCDDDFVIALLTKKQPKGYVALDDVKASLVRDLRNEKKAAQISEATQGKDLNAIASLYNAKVDTAHNVSFAQNSVSGAGVEPALVGKALSLGNGNSFSAVQGNNGAYAVKVLSTKAADISDDKVKSAFQQLYQGVQYYLSQIITDVDVEDNRIRFF